LLGIPEVLSKLLKFRCAQLHFVTTQLANLHDYNNIHAQTEFVVGSKKMKRTKKCFPIALQTAQPKKRCA
jgi:hypothetical protein